MNDCEVATPVFVLDGKGTPLLSEGSIVRISASGMAGSEFEIDIDGPACLFRQHQIVRLLDGRQSVGAIEEEFEIRLTGKG